MSESKRFVQLGDTHIKDTLTGEEWYAPCETSLLAILNEQEDKIHKLSIKWRVLSQENEKLRKDLNKLYNLLMDKGMSHNELQDVLWGIDDE